jgi:uncharacterized membrane protein
MKQKLFKPLGLLYLVALIISVLFVALQHAYVLWYLIFFFFALGEGRSLSRRKKPEDKNERFKELVQLLRNIALMLCLFFLGLFRIGNNVSFPTGQDPNFMIAILVAMLFVLFVSAVLWFVLYFWATVWGLI